MNLMSYARQIMLTSFWLCHSFLASAFIHMLFLLTRLLYTTSSNFYFSFNNLPKSHRLQEAFLDYLSLLMTPYRLIL